MTAAKTTTSAETLHAMLHGGIVAVVRLTEATPMRPVAAAAAAGGVGAFEITMTTPGALDLVHDLATGDTGCAIGAGTVLDECGAAEVIEAGAQFVVSPTLDEGMIRYCRERDVVCMPGAFSPTEILRAWQAGASLVKVFPSSSVGPDFFRNILAPLPFLRLVPSGGITLENCGEWIKAGAVAISASNALITPARVRPDAHAELTARARAFVNAVAQARRDIASSRV